MMITMHQVVARLKEKKNSILHNFNYKILIIVFLLAKIR